MGFSIEYRGPIDGGNLLDFGWRNESLFLRCDRRNSYRVLGMLKGLRIENGQKIYSVEPLEKRLYKNCRAFIRGCKDLGDPAHASISFVPQERRKD